MLLKCCTQYASKFEKLSSGHRTGKCQFSFQSQRREMPKKVQTLTQLHSFHMLANWCWKILQARPSTVCEMRISRCTSWIYKKQRNQRSNCQHSLDHRKSKSSRETSTSGSLTMLKPLTVWITTNGGKHSKRYRYQTILPAPWEICMQVKKQQLYPGMEQWTGSKLGKECIKLYIVTLLI